MRILCDLPHLCRSAVHFYVCAKLAANGRIHIAARLPNNSGFSYSSNSFGRLLAILALALDACRACSDKKIVMPT